MFLSGKMAFSHCEYAINLVKMTSLTAIRCHHFAQGCLCLVACGNIISDNKTIVLQKDYCIQIRRTPSLLYKKVSSWDSQVELFQLRISTQLTYWFRNWCNQACDDSAQAWWHQFVVCISNNRMRVRIVFSPGAGAAGGETSITLRKGYCFGKAIPFLNF